MIKNGVALVRVSNSPNGCATSSPRSRSSLDEFYVVVVDGKILPTRWMTYASAFKHLERLQEEARADVA
jgi:hypothetical protein